VTLALNPKITDAALALAPNGTGTGFAITLTHIAIGTSLYAPTGKEIALKNEVARYPIGGGSKPTATSIQTGVTITDTDPQGRSPNGLSIGEIGWFGVPASNPGATPTLCAVWSRATGGALFVKSANFPVPFAYTMDISAFPEGSVNVTVGVDPQGMATLILQHKAEVDPHTQYVQKARGMGEYDVKTTYGIGAKVTGPDNKTYRSIVANNTGNTPATSPTKWERWGHSVAEMDAEFVPKRTAVQMGSADTLGVLRVSNPAGGTYGAAGTATGAIRMVFPTGSQAKDTYIRLRVDVFESTDRKAFSAILAGHVGTNLAWDSCEAAVLGQSAANDLNIRFGNDGTKPCILIGETNTAWKTLRVAVTELMVSQNADGGDALLWSSGWAVNLVTALGAISQTLNVIKGSASNLVFGQTDVDHVAGLADILATKQGGLGYTPVQQGGGLGQNTDKVYIGNSALGLKATVNGIDLGMFAFLNSPAFTGAPTSPPITDIANATLQIANAAFVQAAIGNALIGSIHFEARSAARAGFSICNGAELSRASYPALWAYAQSSGALVDETTWWAGRWGGFSYGPGGVNGGTFRIPYLIGEFIRCWDAGRGADLNRVLGSIQYSQNLSHQHGGRLWSNLAGNHYHTGTVDANGNHQHNASTSASGDHQHVSPFGENWGYPWGAYAGGQAGSHSSDNDNNWPWTSPAGNHAHSLTTDTQGWHAHTFTTSWSVQGDHQHFTDIPLDGGGEARPRNIALTPMIRLN
jgi:hypothetical protein